MKQSWGKLSCWNLCAHVMWDLFCQWWDHSTQGPAPGAISYCVLLPAQACCHGIAASTCLLEEENKKAAIWCVVLILQGLFSPFFMFFWLLQFPSSLLGHLGTEGQLQDAERLRQILAKLPFTKNNLILFFFPPSPCPHIFCSYQHWNYMLDICAVSCFLWGFWLVLSTHRHLLPDATRGTSSSCPAGWDSAHNPFPSLLQGFSSQQHSHSREQWPSQLKCLELKALKITLPQA